MRRLQPVQPGMPRRRMHHDEGSAERVRADDVEAVRCRQGPARPKIRTLPYGSFADLSDAACHPERSEGSARRRQDSLLGELQSRVASC